MMSTLLRRGFCGNAAATAVIGGATAATTSSAAATQLPCRRWLRDRPVRNMALPLVVSEVLTRGVVEEGGGSGAELTVRGWIRSVRRQKRIAFLNIADGSSLDGLQVVVTDPTMVDGIAAGASAAITGRLVASPKAGQPVELDASSIKLIGGSDAAAYPIQGRPSLESLRETPHLRPRTAVIAAMVRTRSALEASVHDFFQENRFFHTHTPVITSNDCEGGGEAFSVVAPAYEQAKAKGKAKAAEKVTGNKTSGGEGGEVGEGGEEDKAAAAGAAVSFFGKPVHLTVSGQLHAEALACALSRVYILGPTFRAENSHSTRHLAEFYMLEAEAAFADMDDAMDIAEECIKSCYESIMYQCPDDVQLLRERGGAKRDTDLEDKDAAAAAHVMLDESMGRPFARMSYTAAIAALQASGEPFKFPVEWGIDLKFEHEQWLAQQHCQGPVFVTDYPAAIKPFYARANSDGKTAATFDLLVPGIGELVGGSAREERIAYLKDAVDAHGLAEGGGLDWYLDLRRFGTVPHAGFGIGFERMFQYFTGIANIRDAVPFPRHAGTCRL